MTASCCERHALSKARPVAPGYKVDARTVARIADVWRAVSYLWMDADALVEMRNALQRNDRNGAINAVPNLRNPHDTRAKEKARKLVDILVERLKPVFAASANAEYKRVGAMLRVAKAKKNERNRYVEVPHDMDFIREEAARLVVDITDEQLQNLREVIAMRFDPNVRPENIMRDIKWTVGLDPRSLRAVFNRQAKMREAGATEAKIIQETERYSNKLHQLRAERIARTETVAIESQARQTAWEVARSDGTIPKTAVKEWVASNNACDDCKELDGQTIPIDGAWHSKKYGRVKRGPLHPQCECMQVLNVEDL